MCHPKAKEKIKIRRLGLTGKRRTCDVGSGNNLTQSPVPAGTRRCQISPAFRRDPTARDTRPTITILTGVELVRQSCLIQNDTGRTATSFGAPPYLTRLLEYPTMN